MGEITKSNPICQTGGVKNHVNTSFKKNKKINLTAMPRVGGKRKVQNFEIKILDFFFTPSPVERAGERLVYTTF